LAGSIAIGAIAGGVAMTVFFADQAREAARANEKVQASRRFEQYAGLIQDADAAYRADDFTVMQARLLKAEPRLRSWEWRFLWAASEQLRAARTTPGGRTSPAGVFPSEEFKVSEHLVYSPFQSISRYVQAERVFEVLNFSDFSVHTTIRDVPRPWRWGVTRDGRYVVLAGMGDHSAVQIYDCATGTLLAERRGFRVQDSIVSIHPDGRSFALAGDDGPARFFSLPALEPLGELGFQGKIDGIDHSPDGTMVLIAAFPADLSVFRTSDHSLVAKCDTRGAMPIYPFFSDDSARIASLNHRESNLNL
jgi:WD40 repeat protein